MAARKINLGTFASGEIPFPVLHAFKRGDSAVDLTGWTPFVMIEGPDETVTYGNGVVTIDGSPTLGVVMYEWDSADMVDFGKYRMLIWVEDGTYRLASDLVIYEVYDGPGPTPT